MDDASQRRSRPIFRSSSPIMTSPSNSRRSTPRIRSSSPPTMVQRIFGGIRFNEGGECGGVVNKEDSRSAIPSPAAARREPTEFRRTPRRIAPLRPSFVANNNGNDQRQSSPERFGVSQPPMEGRSSHFRREPARRQPSPLLAFFPASAQKFSGARGGIKKYGDRGDAVPEEQRPEEMDVQEEEEEFDFV